MSRCRQRHSLIAWALFWISLFSGKRLKVEKQRSYQKTAVKQVDSLKEAQIDVASLERVPTVPGLKQDPAIKHERYTRGKGRVIRTGLPRE